MKELNIFVNRMRRINIEISLRGNYPWIYLDTVNGKKVTERFWANHGFTVGFLPIQVGRKFDFLDISKLFEIIRKYK